MTVPLNINRWRRAASNFYASRLDPLIGPPRAMPDAIIIGAQRAGTTSLFRTLSGHPAVVPAKTKEVHFFDLNYGRGLGWYRYHFPPTDQTGARAVRLESSPYYLFHPLAPDRIRTHLPAGKFVVLLRDPAERAYSQYRHERRQGREPLSWNDALAAENERISGEKRALEAGEIAYGWHHHRHSYFSRGLYAEQIARWFAAFPAEQFLFVESESLFSDPDEELARVCAFLGIDHAQCPTLSRENKGGYNDSDDLAAITALRARYAEPNRRLEDLLGRRFRWMER